MLKIYYDMKKEQLIKFVKDKYHIDASICYKANAIHLNMDNTEQIMQGYVVDDYFVDIKSLQIFNKSYFDLINNIEDTENL